MRIDKMKKYAVKRGEKEIIIEALSVRINEVTNQIVFKKKDYEKDYRFEGN